VSAFPSFALSTADDRLVTDADLRGRPHVVYVARHLG